MGFEVYRATGEDGWDACSLSGRATFCYDHGYNAEVFYLGLALDPHYVDGWVEGYLERIGEDDPDEERHFRDLWDEETRQDVMI
jgi:hypothetical protein